MIWNLTRKNRKHRKSVFLPIFPTWNCYFGYLCGAVYLPHKPLTNTHHLNLCTMIIFAFSQISYGALISTNRSLTGDSHVIVSLNSNNIFNATKLPYKHVKKVFFLISFYFIIFLLFSSLCVYYFYNISFNPILPFK